MTRLTSQTRKPTINRHAPALLPGLQVQPGTNATFDDICRATKLAINTKEANVATAKRPLPTTQPKNREIVSVLNHEGHVLFITSLTIEPLGLVNFLVALPHHLQPGIEVF